MPGRELMLKADLSRNLGLFFFDDDEIREIISTIDEFDPEVKRQVLALCVYFSNASANAVPKVLRHLKTAARTLPVEDMKRWVAHAFELLDSQGIEPAMGFITGTDRESLEAFIYPTALALDMVSGGLTTYLAGISGMDLKIKADGVPHTDGETVYLPASMGELERADDNFLIYKLAVSYAWAQIQSGTLAPVEGNDGDASGLEAMLGVYDDRGLAVDLYMILEAFRLEVFLKARLPGLIRRSSLIKRSLSLSRMPMETMSEKTSSVELIYMEFLGSAPRRPTSATGRLVQDYRNAPAPDMNALRALYDRTIALDGQYARVQPIQFIGTLKPEKVSMRLRAMRQAEQKRVEGLIDRILDMPESRVIISRLPGGEEPPPREPRADRKYMLIKGMLVEIDEKTASAMEGRIGELPAVLVDGSDLGGPQRYIELEYLAGEQEAEAEEHPGGIRYDEWDFRRKGFRKGWCTLFEHDAHPGREPFVEITLRKYGGYVNTLRKRFEAMRTEPRMLKRQRDGDDIDYDAVVESVSDASAGLSPKDELFTKLGRSERNIAVLFLLDMSGSTKGWVNVAEKEALVLMCEALEALGDRYGIFGFSGMTRNRCDFYRIKDFEERYSGDVKRRISGIAPKDYTRMGPAIRHATNIITSVEARTRLLVTLSDGKPEDYDAYRGAYGIEDTRKALIEARERNVHAFCITIDKEARTYLPHMYGRSNYIMLEDVGRLPSRITEIYRRLTS